MHQEALKHQVSPKPQKQQPENDEANKLIGTVLTLHQNFIKDQSSQSSIIDPEEQVEASVHSDARRLNEGNSSEEVDEPFPKETDYEMEPPKVLP